MASHLSINSFKKTSFCVALIMGLSSCSVFKHNDHKVKDSLYVWSDSYYNSSENNVVGAKYQTIKSLEEDISKSDVQFIFDAMVNNTIPEIDLAPELPNNEQPQLGKNPDVLHTLKKSEIDPEAETIVQKTAEMVAMTESLKSDIASLKANIASIEAINRLTEENPTAAGIPVNTVLPEVKQEPKEISVPNEILKLAAPVDYQINNPEYGMWQLAKSTNSQYHESCSLTSATIQVEADSYSTQVWLRVVGNNLLVNSTTNIDINKPGVGVKFDSGPRQTFNKKYFQTSAVWSGDLQSALKNNLQLNVSLGGNELGLRTQEVVINLKDLEVAYSEYSQCNKGLQIVSL